MSHKLWLLVDLFTKKYELLPDMAIAVEQTMSDLEHFR